MSYYFQGFPTVLYDVHNDGHPVEVTDIFRAVRLKPEVRDDMLLYTSYTIQDGERPDHVSMKLYNSVDYYWVFFMVNENLVNLYTDWPLSSLELQNAIDVKYAGYVLTSNNDFSSSFVQNETITGLVSGATATLTEKDINTGVLKVTNVVGTFRSNELIRGNTSRSTLVISGYRPFKDVIHHYENVDGNIVGRYDAGALPITNDEYERAENEKKSIIQVVKPQYIAKVAAEFFNQINPEQA